MAGSLQKSTDVMKSMQQLVKVPELQATMREMQKEMMRVSLCLLLNTLHLIHVHIKIICAE